jgi:hypothetical protein
MHVGHRHRAQRGNRRYAVREEAAAGVTLGECAVTSPPPAMPSATALRARERGAARARGEGTLGVDGISFTVHPWGTRNRWIGILRLRFDMLK